MEGGELGLVGPGPYGKPNLGLMGSLGGLGPDLMGPVPYGTWALWDLGLHGGARTLWDLEFMGLAAYGAAVCMIFNHTLPHLLQKWKQFRQR